MKIDGVRHITDRKELHDIFKNIFMGSSVMLKSRGLNIKVDIVRIEESKIYISLQDSQEKIQASALFTRYNDKIYFSHVISHGHEGDLLIFEPEGIQVFTAARKEERKKTDDKAGKKALITNIISSPVIEESFRHNRSRAEWMRSEIAGRFEGKFEHIRIFFTGDRKSDNRMKWVTEERKPVFIPAIPAKQDGTDSETCSRYMNEIFYSDPLLKEGHFQSEIIVPLLYRGMLPFGYIQINHFEKLSDSALTFTKRMALAFSESITKDMLLFKPSEDSMMITDLSLSGLGILFRERTLIRHFNENESIVSTVYMPENKQATMMIKIMNINQISKYYRIGCMIINIDPIGDANYQEFLGEL